MTITGEECPGRLETLCRVEANRRGLDDGLDGRR
jgi:hypothetical protein